MALLNFGAESQVKLGKILGSFDTTIQERVVRSQTGYIENQYFQVTEQVDIEAVGEEEASTEFKAIEVQPDGNPVVNGIVFDSDKEPSTEVTDPIYLPNLKFNSTLFSGSVEVGKAYTVEEVDSDTFGEASDWFIIPKGGAGGGALYAKLKAKDSSSPNYLGDIYSDPNDLEGNDPIEVDVLCIPTMLIMAKYH